MLNQLVLNDGVSKVSSRLEIELAGGINSKYLTLVGICHIIRKMCESKLAKKVTTSITWNWFHFKMSDEEQKTISANYVGGELLLVVVTQVNFSSS